MAAQLHKYGPMSISVDASAWQYYRGGVLRASACGRRLDHAVQLVGFNVGHGYWIVRNSWGERWGEHGFIRLQFGHNTCGMSDYGTLAVA